LKNTPTTQHSLLTTATAPPLRYPIARIVSGGQTGADRAALDWAIDCGVPHGGWCPVGRRAEDGVIGPRYQLTETSSRGYWHRTRLNVRDSDGTLILILGRVEGGTLETLHYARQLLKPRVLVSLDAGITDRVIETIEPWLQLSSIRTLNVAGPRESERPGIYRLTYSLLCRQFLEQD
jgi:hypothetical protein